MIMRNLFLALLLLCGLGTAQATHLQNVGSNYCAKADLTQATCAASSTQDVSFDEMPSSKYRIRFGSLCLAASTGAVGEALTLATCSSASGQLWTVYKDPATPNSRQYQNDVIAGTQGAGNCLGINPAAPTSAGSALSLVYCIDPSREWATDLEYVYSQKPSATTTPVFAISGSALGAKVPAATATVGAACSCSTFAAGAYCALAATPTRAALCRPFGGRTVASNAPLTHTTRPVPNTPTPASMAARARAGQLTSSVRIDLVSGSPGSPTVYHDLDIQPTDPTDVCTYISPDFHDITIQDSRIGNCRYGIFAPGMGNNIIIQRNVFHDVASAVYAPASGSASGNTGTFQFTKNFVYNLVDSNQPYDGAMFQIGNSRPGTMQSKIECNVYHGRYTTGIAAGRQAHTIDKINLSGSTGGNSSQPLLVRYNRAIGPKSQRAAWSGVDPSAGTFAQIGDTPDATTLNSYMEFAYNSVVFMNGQPFTVSSGDHIDIHDNAADQRGEAKPTLTGVTYNWSDYYGAGGGGCTGGPMNCNGVCTNLTVTNNRGAATLWYFTSTGTPYSAANDGNCSPKTITSNNFGDTTLGGEALFEASYPACD